MSVQQQQRRGRARGSSSHLRVIEDDGPPDDMPHGRPPPHDLEAEAAVLSAVMLDSSLCQRVLDILEPEHMYATDSHGRVLEAVKALSIAQQPIDLVSVASWLRDRGWPSPSGATWSAFVAQLADAAPAVHPEHVVAHARMVREKWRLRMLIATAQRISAGGYGDVGEVQSYIDEAESAIASIGRHGAGGDLDRFAIGRIAAESIAATANAPLTTGPWIRTGIKEVDRVTGLYPSEVCLLGAPKGLGKTTLARFITNGVARSRRPLVDGRPDCSKCKCEEPCSDEHRVGPPRGVLVFALEGKREDWSDGLAASEGGLNLFERRNGRWTLEQTTEFIGELEALKRVPVVIDDRKDLCRANLGARVRAWRDWFARKGAVLELVILDYFQIGAWERGGDSRESDLSDAGRHLITLATSPDSDLRGLAWLVISALNKDGGTRESGALEYHTDTFWRLSEAKGEPQLTGKPLKLWIEKQRRGPSKISIPFYADLTRGTFW